ncbi:transcriptional regulator [Dyadobacter luteus]|uniref:Transcriptional regulator n=1 Tax=Dyadobacter luteus TaxID=2259619 RepID=A0A3D8Y3G9_9BACT|nr:transcriptional regulator [Dyadobacter luteus]REA56609.1 transcriptional regulator [Dyadobacter luteus]
METQVYQQKAQKLVADMKEIIDVKGIDLSSALKNSGVSEADAKKILEGKKLPALEEFLALCEISGITFSIPSVETPPNPM